jgi:hypothetical protein
MSIVPTVTESYLPLDRAPDEAWGRRFRFLSLVCMTAATVVGLGVAFGEIIDVRWLSAGPGAWRVRPVPVPSLAGSLITVAGLWLVLFSGGRYVGRGRVALAAVLVAGAGWLVITFFTAAIDPMGDQVPASSAAFGLSAVAAAGLLLSMRRGAAAGQIVAMLAVTTATVPLLGYLLGARALAGFPFGFGTISVPTIIIVILLSAAIVFARPDAGLIDVATARSPGGVVLRRLVAPVLLLPPVLIVAISAGELRPLRTLAWVGSALSAVGLVALVATARALDRVDEARRRAADEAVAMAAGLAQDTEIVVQLGRSLGLVGAVPEPLAVSVRRAAAEGVVGGDAYGLVEVGPGRLAIVLVDIASKGAEPSMVAVRLRDAMTSALRAGLSPAGAMTSIVWLVAATGTTATAFVAVVDIGRAELVYASAGHVPGLLRASDGVHLLERTGPLLHPDVYAGWADAVRPYGSGDSVLTYTDGVADVVVRPDGGISIEGFIALVEECPHREADRLVAWCMDRLESSVDWVLHDDATLIVVSHGPGGSGARSRPARRAADLSGGSG